MMISCLLTFSFIVNIYLYICSNGCATSEDLLWKLEALQSFIHDLHWPDEVFAEHLAHRLKLMAADMIEAAAKRWIEPEVLLFMNVERWCRGSRVGPNVQKNCIQNRIQKLSFKTWRSMPNMTFDAKHDVWCHSVLIDVSWRHMMSVNMLSLSVAQCWSLSLSWINEKAFHPAYSVFYCNGSELAHFK